MILSSVFTFLYTINRYKLITCILFFFFYKIIVDVRVIQKNISFNSIRYFTCVINIFLWRNTYLYIYICVCINLFFNVIINTYILMRETHNVYSVNTKRQAATMHLPRLRKYIVIIFFTLMFQNDYRDENGKLLSGYYFCCSLAVLVRDLRWPLISGSICGPFVHFRIRCAARTRV